MRPFSRRQWLKASPLSAAALFAPGLEGLAPAMQTGGLATALMLPAASDAVEAGLSYLARRHNADGTLGRSPYSANAAVVALAGLAYMSRGNTPGRGPYGEQVQQCVDYLLQQQAEESGFIETPGRGPMYGHGFATMFLAEAYGMAPDSSIREPLSQAVQLIVTSQNAAGGWRYDPKSNEADLSVTICQIMALRAARNAGLYVPNETVERCLGYVKRCQNADGGFMYMLSQPGDSRFPRSAAGVVALYSAGIYEGEEIDRGLKYLIDHAPQGRGPVREDYYFYGQYYAAQAMWHAGGEYWRRWYPSVSDTLLALQQTSGAWEDSISPEYGTAMACIVLQMPNSYLPIFQR